MSTNSMLSFGNHQHNPVMDSETGVMSIDHGGEWDISLFDELDNLGDTDELLQALEHAGYASELDFDIDIPPWNEVDTSSTCTDGEVSLDSLSPAHTLSSVPSPTSVEALSPYFLQDEALSPQSQSSSVSVCSESSGFSVISPPAKKAPKRTSQTARARQAQPIKRPIQIGQRVSIQPKPLITAVPLAHASAPLQAKTIIIQPLQTAVLPVVKQAPINIQPAPINIQPAPPPGHTIVLSQPSQVLQIQTTRAVTANVVTMPTLSQDRHLPVAAPVTLRTPSSDDESKLGQRQQRMIKNRESASLSRKKKKDYLLSLEARLKMALSENEELKSENGTLKKQLEGLLSENTVLKVTAPKRRAVCLMVVLVFVMLNIGPMSLFQGGPGSKLSMQHGGRHLLGFSSEAETEVVMGPDPLDSGPSEMADSSEDKALMVVKDPIFLRPPPPCQPPVNRTKCRELAHELRGWVHRHEVQQTKSRRMSNSNNKPTRTILKTENKEADGAQIVTVQYTETTEGKNLGNELQVYYAPHHTYSDFFDEINRRGDTFYVVSFRRDHLLLPATNHNKGSRPKMSLVLPAMNINDSIIRDKDYEVMMQIDCEVTDTRILHIRSSSIPPLLRVNRTGTFYQHPSTDSQAAPPVGVLMGSA
ncbi:cyclic AMP-dependent transcription factor ATF-6 alpha isoform X1 [Etheostoma cragini]|uniref:cyclic AMP-dependent transcription factor ATF-6 alpha isoform X1 n=1 Tax=Etheostoma cragini TaxID=417921 RepID=UPI00155E26D4|nr:cyclic AMP-dependent transcription factor ATF-6 alpha isoform X1 [Etheostoma cragini]